MKNESHVSAINKYRQYQSLLTFISLCLVNLSDISDVKYSVQVLPIPLSVNAEVCYLCNHQYSHILHACIHSTYVKTGPVPDLGIQR